MPPQYSSLIVGQYCSWYITYQHYDTQYHTDMLTSLNFFTIIGIVQYTSVWIFQLHTCIQKVTIQCNIKRILYLVNNSPVGMRALTLLSWRFPQLTAATIFKAFYEANTPLYQVEWLLMWAHISSMPWAGSMLSCYGQSACMQQMLCFLWLTAWELGSQKASGSS